MRAVRHSLGLKLQIAMLAVALVALVTMATVVLLFGPSLFSGDPHVRHHGLEPQLRRSFDDTVLEAVLIGTAAAVLTAGIASIVVARRVVEPLVTLRGTARRMADGRYAQRAHVAGEDEVAGLADALNDLAAALERAEEQRRALLADLAHELRTPLATIDAYLEGLADGVVDPTPETVALLRSETGRLRRLVEDVREVSRAESRQLRLAPRPVEPAAAIASAAAAARPAFTAKGVALTVGDGRPPAVLADPDRVEQILANLLSNALRHTQAGGEVRLDAAGSGNRVRIRVTDTGEGIAAGDLPRVFDRFFRGDASRARDAGGSGIGLTVARALAEAQGGTLVAASDGPGTGATFTLELPLATPGRRGET